DLTPLHRAPVFIDDLDASQSDAVVAGCGRCVPDLPGTDAASAAEVFGQGVVHIAVEPKLTRLEPEDALTELRDDLQVVADEHHGSAASADLANSVLAAALEFRV